MKRSLLDTIGVGAVGSRTQIAAMARRFAKQQFAAGDGGPRARLLFDGAEVSPSGAAMAGAFSIDSIDAHDGNSAVKGHAGSAVLPGVLAIADDLRRQGLTFTGKDLLTAMAVAYETAYRSGLALHATVDDYHTSGAWTAVGVAAAGASLLYLGQTALLAAALGLVLAACYPWPPTFDGTPSLPPFTLIPQGLLRFVAFGLTCLAAAALLKRAVRRLWSIATRPETPRGDADE